MKQKSRMKVYCGPTVRGVAKQYTVYSDGVPAALEHFLQAHPLARRLLVSVDDFAAVRAALCTKGSAEAMLMRRLREQLAEEAGAGKSGE